MLKIESVQVSYGAIEAVKGVSMEVRAGEVVAIIGANGAGKSTLLKSICGLEPVAGGRILLDGEDLARVPPHRRVAMGVAMSPEGRGVFADQTVRENLMLGAYGRRKDPVSVEAAIAREFQRFPRLAERQHQLSGTLSGGEQQMVAIGRALLAQPRLLLCDEISLGLAPKIIREIYEVLPEIAKTGTSIIIVEQDVMLAQRASNRLYCMLEGHITLESLSSDVTRADIAQAYFGAGHEVA